MKLFIFFTTCFLSPFLLLYAEKRIPVVAWLGPVFFCYVAGALLGNLGLGNEAMAESLQGPLVVLALPLLMFATQLRHWLTIGPSMLKSQAAYVVSLAIFTTTARFLFENSLAAPWQASAMAFAVYMGATPNMAAVHQALGAPADLFIRLNLSDLVVSGVYLALLFSVFQRVLLLFLPPFPITDAPQEMAASGAASRRAFFTSGLAALFISALIVGASAGLSMWIYGSVNSTWMVVSVTLGGLLASFIRPVQQLKGAHPVGEYLFLVFCVVIGTRIDVRHLLDGSSGATLLFMAFVSYGTVLLHTFLCWRMRIDADTVILTQVAGIFSPPFIGPAARTLRNRAIIPPAMALAVLNVALGTLLGLLLHEALKP